MISQQTREARTVATPSPPHPKWDPRWSLFLTPSAFVRKHTTSSEGAGFTVQEDLILGSSSTPRSSDFRRRQCSAQEGVDRDDHRKATARQLSAARRTHRTRGAFEIPGLVHMNE